MNYSLDIPRTAMEVYEMLPEGTICEVIDNTLYMSPAPTKEHQRLLLSLASQLQAFVLQKDLGEIFITPYDVYLNEKQNLVQPDIFFIKKDKEDIAHSKAVYGSPDFVVEILSSNRVHDQQRKLDLYQQNQVPEYVIIDPDTKQVWHYVLTDNSYQAKTDVTPGQLKLVQLDLMIAF